MGAPASPPAHLPATTAAQRTKEYPDGTGWVLQFFGEVTFIGSTCELDID
jgi:hypothetical protein